jgi:hypothetical protein
MIYLLNKNTEIKVSRYYVISSVLNISDVPKDKSIRVLVTLMALYMYHNFTMNSLP